MHVQFLDNGTKVSALNPKTYVFEPQKSVGDPEVDLIRTINVPAVVSSPPFLLGNHPNSVYIYSLSLRTVSPFVVDKGD